MSAANRNGRARREFDRYRSRPYMVHALLDALPADFPTEGQFWEPAAGEGDIVRPVLYRRPAVRWTATEIDPACRPYLRAAGCAEVEIADTFSRIRRYANRFRVIWTNPPFDTAESFFSELVTQNPRAWIILLQRINFLASARRSPFFRRHPPDLYVLPERPRFEHGRSDQTEYAWFVYPPEAHLGAQREGRRSGSLIVLEPTPIAVRRAQESERNAWRRTVRRRAA
jgi:hypothetical protein